MKLNTQRTRKFILPALLLAALLGTLIGFTSQAAMTGGLVVAAWGQNVSGQLNIPAGLSGVTAIAGGYQHSLALKSDGTVVGWGSNLSGQLNIPAGLSGVTAIAAGKEHSLALKSDGTVVSWGGNVFGQLNIPAGLSGVTAIVAGSQHSLALKSDGTVVGWGYNAYGQLNIPAGLSGVTAIAAGSQHSLALKSDGTVVGWGWNNYGQATIPAGLNGVTAIAAGGQHSLALNSNGTVVGWGWNNHGQVNIRPAAQSGVTAIAAGGLHSLALKSDGTVVGWGNNTFGQLSIPAGNSLTAIAAGDRHNLALKTPPPNTPPVAKSKNITVSAGVGCAATVTASQINNGSYDPDGDQITLSLDSTGPFGLGNRTVTLTVTDSRGASSSAKATVTVVNPQPSLGDYPYFTAIAGSSATITPNAPPADNFSLSSVTVIAPGFTGGLTVNPTTGAVSITNAGPVGGFTVAVKATDSCGASVTKTFTLIVAANNPQCSITASFTPAGGLKTPQILTLDAGGSSDSCNRPLRYYWQCTSGTSLECPGFLAQANANNNTTSVAFLSIQEFDDITITLTVCAADTNHCSLPVPRTYLGAPVGPLFKSPTNSQNGGSKP